MCKKVNNAPVVWDVLSSLCWRGGKYLCRRSSSCCEMPAHVLLWDHAGAHSSDERTGEMAELDRISAKRCWCKEVGGWELHRHAGRVCW